MFKKIIEWFKKNQYISIILVILIIGIILAAFGFIRPIIIGWAVGIIIVVLIVRWITNRTEKTK